MIASPKISPSIQPVGQPDVGIAKTQKAPFANGTDSSYAAALHQARLTNRQNFIPPNAEQNSFKRFWNWLKSLVAQQPKLDFHVEYESMPNLSEVNPNPNLPKIQLTEERQRIDINFVRNNVDKFLFLFSGSQDGEDGLFGQGSVLKPSRKEFPDSVFSIPTSAKAVNSYNTSTAANNAFKEDSQAQIKQNLAYINTVIDKVISKANETGKTILLIKGGYGTGFARMFQYAPQTFNGMNYLLLKKLGVVHAIDPQSGHYQLYTHNDAKTLLEHSQNIELSILNGVKDSGTREFMTQHHGVDNAQGA